MPVPLLALALSLALTAKPAGADPAKGVAAPGVEAAIEAALAAPAGGARAAAATAPLLGVRYLLSPLGEGAGLDPDPRFRLDAFDCVTFVETALALGSSASLAEARRALDDVRYRSRVHVADRLHEVLSQWIPANLEKGWIAPASRAAAGDATRVEAVTYDAARWRRLSASGQRLTGVPLAEAPTGTFEVEVVPLRALQAAAPRIGEGTIAFVVRAARDDRLTRVSHAGLVVVRDGVRLVRHASSSPRSMRVVEEPLDRFVAGQQRAERRPVVGLALFTIEDARARLSGLPAAPPP
jgi:N-acetylmuramoyl-L-alanine amidase-like protein